MTLSDNKKLIIANFDQAATSYDAYADVQKEIAATLRKIVREHLPLARDIVEIGCGTGLFTEHLHSLYPQAEIFATDISKNMVRECSHKFRANERLHYNICDGEFLFLPRQVDLIASNLAFQWFEYLHKSIRKLWPQTHSLAFTVFLEGSFSSWKAAYNDKEEGNVMHPLLSPYEFQDLCNSFDAKKKIVKFQTISRRHLCATDFLHTLREIGAQTPQPGRSPKNLRKVLNQFPNGIEINYEVGYGLLLR